MAPAKAWCPFMATMLVATTILVIVSSCTTQPVPPQPVPAPNDEEPYSGSHGITTTRVLPAAGDKSITIFTDYPSQTLNDSVAEADAIVVGQVIDILPAKETPNPYNPDETTLYTDVVIKTERYLYGETESSYLAIRVGGGRIGDFTVIYSSGPVFNMGEEVVVLLKSLPDLRPPDGIRQGQYYSVVFDMMWKGQYKNDAISAIIQAVDQVHVIE
jgi:hypothetical protein